MCFDLLHMCTELIEFGHEDFFDLFLLLLLQYNLHSFLCRYKSVLFLLLYLHCNFMYLWTVRETLDGFFHHVYLFSVYLGSQS